METHRTSILHLVCHWNFLGLLWYFQVTETFCKDYYFIIIICFYSLYPFFSFILASILSQPLLYNFSLQPNFIVYNFVTNFILRLILCKNHDSALNHCLYIFICFKYTYPASYLPSKNTNKSGSNKYWCCHACIFQIWQRSFMTTYKYPFLTMLKNPQIQEFAQILIWHYPKLLMK